jgi:carbon-monoxide dehydrogenase small subunit
MSQTMPVTMKVNGVLRTVQVHPMERLLDVLRGELRLTGAKEGCGEGECGACAVLMNGRLVTSCLVPVGQADGAEIITVEGVARDGRMTPLQEAFIVHNATQCGFCTPGMVLAAQDLLERTPHPDEPQIRHALAGNVCRCTGYVKIVEAVQAVASASPEQAP